eukprot:scaffold803_cov310-Pinguiococcus_pyrenoidosus.AAC.60
MLSAAKVTFAPEAALDWDSADALVAKLPLDEASLPCDGRDRCETASPEPSPEASRLIGFFGLNDFFLRWFASEVALPVPSSFFPGRDETASPFPGLGRGTERRSAAAWVHSCHPVDVAAAGPPALSAATAVGLAMTLCSAA